MEANYKKDRDIVLMGSGGHCKTIIELLKRYYPEYNIVGITDQDTVKKGMSIYDVPILGDDAILKDLYMAGVKKALITLGTVGNYVPRLKLFNYAKELGYEFINAFHKGAIISNHVSFGEGNVVLPGAMINADTIIGDNCIINTGSIIEHECKIDSNVHIAPGARLAGGVEVMKNSMIGIGANIIQNVTIGENCIIGAGSVVLRDIPNNSIVFGVPAKIIRER